MRNKRASRYIPKLCFSYLTETIYLKIIPNVTIRYPRTAIECTVRNANDWLKLHRGQLEVNCFKVMIEFVEKNNVILDIGAHHGIYSLFFAKMVGEKGAVHAFEPDPKAFEILSDNVEKNHFVNIQIVNSAISNFVGKTMLYPCIRFGSSGSSTMMSSEEANRIEQRIERPVPVETTTVDQYCYQNRIKLDGMKIDVEGAEALVIEGAEKTIEMYHPWVLLEFHPGLLTKEEQSRNWHKILKRSRRAVFIDGNDSRYHYRQLIKDMPQCQNFHVLLEY